MANDQVEKMRKAFGGPMSDDDRAFLQDVKGFIDFATANGLSLPLVVATLAHDVNEISRHGLDLERARKLGFRPKVDGYADFDESEIGESDEAA